ncbi:hypothetical protein ACIBI9_31285 [Nonomuraea sp. NPDC050451]|uniref:hypothetical protein n=1 Tax=Nonomuraea sp. NPDC050451 TaxID=3364364 RepID=UPI00379D0BB1
MRELPEKIPASALKIGDEIELYKEDPVEPLLRMPNHPAVWWTIIGLSHATDMIEEHVGNIHVRQPTIIAELIRDVTPEELELDAERFRLLLITMGLDERSESFRITRRARFFAHHTLKVRREEGKQQVA